MKGIIGTLLVVFATLGVFAQDNTVASATKGKQLTIEQSAQKIVEKFNNIVTLTPEQQAQLRVAAVEFVTKRKEVKSQTKSADMAGKDTEALKANRAEFKSKLKTILTTQQLLKLKSHQKANKAKKDAAKANEVDEIMGE